MYFIDTFPKASFSEKTLFIRVLSHFHTVEWHITGYENIPKEVQLTLIIL